MKITETQLQIVEEILVNDNYIYDSDLALIACYINSWDHTEKEKKRAKRQAAFKILIDAIKYGVEDVK